VLSDTIIYKETHINPEDGGDNFLRNVSNHVPGRLGGVVVSALATGPKDCGSEPGKGDGFLRAINIRTHLPFGWEVKPEGPMS
jgi:hypothetical protein